MTKNTTTKATAALAVVITAAMGLGWYLRIILDDAYISMRYARMAARGHGLVYNVGEPIEGYTNFLWTLLLIPSQWIPVSAETYLYGLGFGTFFALLAIFAWFGQHTTRNRWGAVAATGLVGLQWTTAQFATTGMETLAQTVLVCAAWMLWLTRERTTTSALTKTMGIISILVALAGWTRMDSALLLAPLGAICAWTLFQHAKANGWRAALKPALALAVPVGVLMGGWLAWKLSYYGHILPNTYWAKTAGESMWMRGVLYVILFFEITLFGLPLAGVLAWLFIKKPWTQEDAPSHIHTSSLVGLWSALILWIAYVIRVGGDFMDFRFMISFWALLVILMICIASTFGKKGVAGLMIYVVVQLGAGLFFYQTYENIAGIWTFNAPTSSETNRILDWVDTGKHLHPLIHEIEPKVVIAANTAGGLPYYMDLPTVDMHGLADPWVAKNGDFFVPVPGHTVIAPFGYLQRRKVNLVFDIPLYLKTPDDIKTLCKEAKEEYHKLNAIAKTDATLLFIPQPKKGFVVPVYLTRHEGLDALIAKHQWKQVPVRACFSKDSSSKP